MKRDDFKLLILAALKEYKGQAKIHQVCEHVWTHNSSQIMESKQVLYTWQYDIRWAANKLRRENKIVSEPRGYWKLKIIN